MADVERGEGPESVGSAVAAQQDDADAGEARRAAAQRRQAAARLVSAAAERRAAVLQRKERRRSRALVAWVLGSLAFVAVATVLRVLWTSYHLLCFASDDC